MIFGKDRCLCAQLVAVALLIHFSRDRQANQQVMILFAKKRFVKFSLGNTLGNIV